MKRSRKTIIETPNSPDVETTCAVTVSGTKTKLAPAGAFAAMKRSLMADPVARTAYLEAKARFRVARLVKDMRTYACLTQKELAIRAGVSQKCITKVESAAGPGVPGVGLISRLAQALEVQLVIGYVKLADLAGSRSVSKWERHTGDADLVILQQDASTADSKKIRRELRFVDF